MAVDIPDCRHIQGDLRLLDEIVPFLKEHELKHGDDVSVHVDMFFWFFFVQDRKLKHRISIC